MLIGTILGSFRFKAEIDTVRAQLESLGVTIPAPEKGLPWRPRQGFLPLESELYMTRGQVEAESELVPTIAEQLSYYSVLARSRR